MAKPSSQLIKQREELLAARKDFYKEMSKEEREQLQIIRDLIIDARDGRERSLREWDDHTFSQIVQMCKDNRVSYLGHTKNKGEVRVTTGVTEGKLDAIVNVTYNQNIEPEVHSFNEYDIEDQRLSDALTKINFRTEQMEDAEDFWYEFIYELCSMPAVFVQETCAYETSYEKVIEGNGDWYNYFLLQDAKIENIKEGEFTRKYPLKRLWTAEQVYLGDITIPAHRFQEQPYVVTQRIMAYDGARAVYGKSPRWEYVTPGQAPMFEELNNTYDYTIDWRLTKNMEAGQVEEIVFKSKINDEVQIFLNGVPMLPVGTPMKSQFPRYDMGMYIPKPIHAKFAYGRPIPLMTRVMQALRDEDFRLTILKRRQSIWKPIVTRSEKILKRDMWLPSAVTYGVDKADIQVLTDDKVGNDDFGMQNMIESEIDKMINVNPLLQGQSAGSRATAEEVSTRMRQALIMIGSVLVMYMRAKRDCTYMRIHNLIENFTQPVGRLLNEYTEKEEDIYQAFTINDPIIGEGTEIIQFMDRALLPEERRDVIRIERERMQAGAPVRFKFVNVKELSRIRQYFYVTVTQKEKKTSALQKEMMKKDIMDIVTIGQQIGKMPNPDYLGSELARRSSLDPSKVWQMQAPGQGQRGMLPQGPTDMAGRQPRPQTIQPSIQNMAALDSQSIQV